MLELVFPAIDAWDPVKEQFLNLDPITIKLEHSLVSISKWESKWKKSFISSKDKTQEETMDYFRCMIVEPQSVDDAYFSCMTKEMVESLQKYINDPMTATTISQTKDQRPSREIVTAEIVYYWMVTLRIPFECQYWHFNRLMTLIQVCNIKQQPPKKMSKSQALAQNRSLNAARRAKHHSRG